ncbi:MAG: hypothetical protein SFW07_06535 [Gammaproteobacteria bacterium]|nr:hypothetical protein [Gammaproteobacteria bacterium]
MERLLISVPNALAEKFRHYVPERQRSKVISHLIEEEIERREEALYKCALAVEKDVALNKEMDEWDVTLKDGLNDEEG